MLSFDKYKGPLIFLIVALLLLYVYTFLHPIPTQDSGFIGIGAEILNIGDRAFYFNDQGYGYGEIKGSPLYPFILKSITSLLRVIGADSNSYIWNTCFISITSLLSISSLILLANSTWIFFGEKVAKISSWLFVLCPYTLYYAIDGGLTMYILFGICCQCYVISKSKIYNTIRGSLSTENSVIILVILSIYNSLLRPTGSIFSIFVLFATIILIVKQEHNLNQRYSLRKSFIIYMSPILCILLSLLILYKSSNYIVFSLESFSNEGGNFFGVERSLIRNRLFDNSDQLSLLNQSKKLIYIFLWKSSNFVAGLSDLRDTHTDYNNIITS